MDEIDIWLRTTLTTSDLLKEFCPLIQKAKPTPIKNYLIVIIENASQKAKKIELLKLLQTGTNKDET